MNFSLPRLRIGFTRIPKRFATLLVVTICLVIVVCSTPNQAVSQENTPADYRVEWIEMPPETSGAYVNELAMYTDLDGVPEVAYVVGWQLRTDRADRAAYIYDHFGTLDPAKPQYFYDIQDPALDVAFPPSWLPDAVGSSFVGVNSWGRIVGYVFAPDGKRIGCYLDLFPTDENGNPVPRELKQLVAPALTANNYYGQDVNEAGDILVRNYDGNGIGYPHVQNPDTGEDIEIPVLNKNNCDFNLFRQVVGKTPDGDVFRHTITSPDGSGVTEFFEEFNTYASPQPRINDLGEISVTELVPTGRGKKTSPRPTRVDSIGNIGWQDGSVGYAETINQAGDILYQNYSTGYWLHQDGLDRDYSIRELVSNPDPTFQDSGISQIQGSDRDHSGYSWIIGRADTDDDGQLDLNFLLIPISSDPTPGITVTPASGLITNESGGSDSFDVVLNTEPAANVTIGISSSDTTEGTINANSLTFTPGDWNLPQTVTITGVNDDDVDGEIGYTIETAATTSTDAEYNGLDADDVSVTNEDDDAPPGGGSETFSSDANNSNLDIPDNNSDGVSSDIFADDYGITNLIVNLNISHPRSSDLDVFLIGPDDSQIQLFNFSGDNNVADFNGTSSLGLWTVKVIDSRKKKTGTINNWSITVDY